MQVAPGLQELAILGKVTSSPRRHGPPMNYDQLVVDSFATGHFLSLLGSPEAMAETIQFGPMGEQSRSIDKWIRDENFMNVHVVTTAEELPITETLELCESLQKQFQIKPKVYLNKLLNIPKKDILTLDSKAQDVLLSEIESETTARAHLKKHHLDFIELPLVTSLVTTEIIEALLLSLKETA